MRGSMEQIAYQRRWIGDHGGDLQGYLARYGTADDPDRCGDGGEAIYLGSSCGDY